MGAADAPAQSLTFDRCQTDDEIAPDQREPYEQVALQYATALAKGDMEEAYRLTSPDTRRGVTSEQMKAGLLPAVAPFVEGIGERHVAHSYLLTVIGSTVAHTATCGAGPDKVVVTVKSASKDAYVILDAE